MTGAQASSAIAAGLANVGFRLDRKSLYGIDATVARKAVFHWWTLTRLHIEVVLLVADALTSLDADQITEAALSQAIVSKPGLPQGWQNGVACVPVFISERQAGGLIDWVCDAGQRKRHWAALSYPIAVDPSSGKVIYQSELSKWGRAYLVRLRTLAATTIADAVGEARPPATQ
jgi:hypothetical protein